SVERVIPNPRPDDLLAIRAEAREAAIRAGAHPATVHVHSEINPQTQRVRATAWGATEMRTRDLRLAVSQEGARKIAARSIGVSAEALRLTGRTAAHFVFTTDVVERGFWRWTQTRHPVRVVDHGGFVKVQRSDAVTVQVVAGSVLAELTRLWGAMTV